MVRSTIGLLLLCIPDTHIKPKPNVGPTIATTYDGYLTTRFIIVIDKSWGTWNTCTKCTIGFIGGSIYTGDTVGLPNIWLTSTMLGV